MDYKETNTPKEEQLEKTLENAETSAIAPEKDEQKQVEKNEEKLTSPSEDDNTILQDEENSKARTTIKEILDCLQNYLEEKEIKTRDEIDSLKHQFYKINKRNNETAKKVFIEAGNNESEFIPENNNEDESKLKELLNLYKTKRAEETSKIEKEQNDNLAIKLQIIENINNLCENTEDINKNFQEFRLLQQKWKETGNIPQKDEREIWKKFQIVVEKFYDLVKINNEFRDYDFKKNLEIKNKLCEKAENLTEEKDIVYAFRQLQKLHEEWRDTGPVAKDIREDLWNRFKNASTIINKKHQAHFEEIKNQEKENLDKKTELCKEIEDIDTSGLTNYREWDDKTKYIIELQAKWKKIGFAPKKYNTKIFERFRASCDKFFQAKSEFFKESKKQLIINLEKKKEFCEKAEALKDSEEWDKTANILIQLQKEWKNIGPVPKKHSNAIWKRFTTACDFFFENKEKVNPSKRSIEKNNLETKKEIINTIENINKELPEEEAKKIIKDAIKKWNETGHVPFKEKDKIYKKWNDVLDTVKSIVPEKGNTVKLRTKLVKKYESLENEIKTSENNIGFFSASNKSGNKLVEELEKKIKDLKEKKSEILKQIRTLEDQE